MTSPNSLFGKIALLAITPGFALLAALGALHFPMDRLSYAALGAAYVLSLLLAFWLSRRWQRSINTITQALEHIADDETDARAEPQIKARPRDLQQSLDAMFKRLAKKDERAKRCAETLGDENLALRERVAELSDLAEEQERQAAQLRQQHQATGTQLEQERQRNTQLEQKFAERSKALGQVRRSMELALNANAIGYWEMDTQSGVGQTNQRLEELLRADHTPIEQPSALWLSRVHPQDQARVQKGWQRFLNGEIGHFEMEHRVQGPGDSEAWHLIRAIRDETADRVIATVMDISDRKAAHAELEKARQLAQEVGIAKSHFLSNMSHEIRTPMNAIIGLSHLTLGTELNHRQHDYVSKIRGSAQNLLSLINDILDFSRIETDELELDRVDFSLEEVLDNLTGAVSELAAEKDLEFMISTAPEVPFGLNGDPLRLGQILINLCNNAVKFTDSGSVTVKIDVDPGHEPEQHIRLRFSVTDTGIGLTREQSDRLFESFSQADASPTRKHGGMGLGLVLSRRLTQLMDGDLAVDSEPGKGATFSFTAKLGIAHDLPRRAWLEQHELADKRVLICDDNPTSRHILHQQLSQFGLEVSDASSGQEAIDKAREADAVQPFDLILMDSSMPGMDGPEAARRIKQDEAIHRPPAIILVSAYGRDELLQQARDLELDAYLTKPVNNATMRGALIKVFGLGESPDSEGSPGESSAAQVTQPEARETPESRLRGAHLLVVEDNKINQHVARRVLENAGMRVSLADNGAIALHMIQEQTFDGILMDVRMPVMDGLEATRELRQRPGFAALPVIAMTANALAADREQCRQAGMNDHVAKPFEVTELLEVLSRWVEPGDPTPSESNADDAPDESAEEHSASTSLPRLPGIDTAAGLDRVGGNSEQYRKLLSKFANSQSGAVQRIRQALERGDRESAQMEAHTLSGVAGNIGANMLKQAARNLELSLRAGDDPQALVQAAEAALGHVLDSLQSLEAEPTVSQTDTRMVAELDPMAMRSRLHDLKVLLEDDDSESRDCLENILERFPGSPFDQDLQRIANLIEDYDFEAALRVLNGFTNAAGMEI
ncbi:MAG: response regulator [Gammaproteobacteria bacterium]